MTTTQETVEARVRRVLEDQAGISEIKGSDRLVDDAGFDSLDVVEFSMALEEEFECTISDEEMADLVTFDNVVTLLNKKISK